MKLRWGIFAVAIAAALLIAFAVPKLGSTGAVASGSLTLPDGSSIQLAAVTYGTNHWVRSPGARLVALLPSAIGSWVSKISGPNATRSSFLSTGLPALVVWFERSTNAQLIASSPAHLLVYLADETGSLGGPQALYPVGLNPVPLTFLSFPKHGQTITAQLFCRGQRGNFERVGQFQFGNPVSVKPPAWTSQDMPTTNQTEDVEVSVQHFFTGLGSSRDYRSEPGGKARLNAGLAGNEWEPQSLLVLGIRSRMNPRHEWIPSGVRLTDSAGNSISNELFNLQQVGFGSEGNAIYAVDFSPSLWPGLTPWKVDLAVKRAKGFTEDELLRFRHVPLGELNTTNSIGVTVSAGDVTLSLDSIIRRPPVTNSIWTASLASTVTFTEQGLADGYVLELISILVDGKKRDVEWSSRKGDQRIFMFRTIPTTAKEIEFLFAVHRSRRVQFLVKPELGPVDIELPTGP